MESVFAVLCLFLVLQDTTISFAHPNVVSTTPDPRVFIDACERPYQRFCKFNWWAADSEDCQAFWRCASGFWVQQFCADGTMFDVDTFQCLQWGYACQEPCPPYTGPPPVDPTRMPAGPCPWVDESNCIQDENYQDSVVCDVYYRCTNNQLIQTDCPLNTLFDLDTRTCITPFPGFSCEPRCPAAYTFSTDAPVTDEATDAPVTNRRTTAGDEPPSDAPQTTQQHNPATAFTQTPVTDDGISDAPVTDDGISDAPVTDDGVSDAPVTDDGISDAPVTDDGVSDAPVTDDGISDAPVTDDGVSDAPVTDHKTEAPVTDRETEAPVTQGETTRLPPTTEEPPRRTTVVETTEARTTTKQPPVTQGPPDEECDGKEDGEWLENSDCTRAWVCVDNRIVFIQCDLEQGLVVDSETLTCKLFYEATGQCRTTKSCYLVSPGTYPICVLDCTWRFTCFGGHNTPFYEQCGTQGTSYDFYLQRCDWPQNVCQPCGFRDDDECAGMDIICELGDTPNPAK